MTLLNVSMTAAQTTAQLAAIQATLARGEVGGVHVNESVDEPDPWMSGPDSDRRCGLDENAAEAQWEAASW